MIICQLYHTVVVPEPLPSACAISLLFCIDNIFHIDEKPIPTFKCCFQVQPFSFFHPRFQCRLHFAVVSQQEMKWEDAGYDGEFGRAIVTGLETTWCFNPDFD